MTKATAWPTQDQYQDLKEELQRTVQARPNYQETMDFHKSLEKLFKKGPHRLRILAAWHWDDEQSTHAADTFLTYPDGQNIAVVITRHIGKDGFLVQATHTTPDAEAPDSPARSAIDLISIQFATEYHTHDDPQKGTLHITYDVCPSTAELAGTINRVAQSAATTAALLSISRADTPAA